MPGQSRHAPALVASVAGFVLLVLALNSEGLR
jgi:hypothetical protein